MISELRHTVLEACELSVCLSGLWPERRSHGRQHEGGTEPLLRCSKLAVPEIGTMVMERGPALPCYRDTRESLHFCKIVFLFP